MERSLIIIKSDGVKKKIVGEIISRFEKRGLEILEIKKLTIGTELAEKHYEEHKTKPFFKELVDFITAGPSVLFIVEGLNAVSAVRKTVGATNPANAEPGTIRGDYALDISSNIIHSCDCINISNR